MVVKSKSSKVFRAEDFDDLSSLVKEVLTSPSISKNEKKQIPDLFKRAKITRKESSRAEATIEDNVVARRNIKVFLSTENLTSEERLNCERQIEVLDTRILGKRKKMRKLRDDFLLWAFSLEERVAKFLE